jgi:hypothetical protein
MGRNRRFIKPATRLLPQSRSQENTKNRIVAPWVTHSIVAVALALGAILAYSNSFNAGFTFDNEFLILRDARIQNATLQNVSSILSHTYWWPTNGTGLYRPFTTLTYLFNYAVLGNGDQPAGYHWINLILHAVNAMLVYLLALRLTLKVWPAAFIAAVWAVHPVLTESVTNIIGRADLLAALALLSSFLMYLKSTDSAGWHRVVWLIGLAGATTVGVFSKESAVAILGVIVLYEITWWKERKQIRGLLYGCVTAAAPILVMWYQRSVVLAGPAPRAIQFLDNPLVSASFLGGRLTAIELMARYLWLLLWPLNLSCDYSFDQIPVASGALRDWVAWIVVLIVIGCAVSVFKRSPAAFFFAGFAFVTFIPTSNLPFLIGTIMAERFLYLTAIGFAGCLVLVVYAIGRRVGWPRFAPVALGLIVCMFGVRTWERNFDWKDNVTLWTAAVHAAPNSFKAHGELAEALYQADPAHSNIDQSIREAEEGLAILDPLPDSLNNPFPYVNAGNYFAVKGRFLMGRAPNGAAINTPESLIAYQTSLKILLRGVAIDKSTNERHRTEELARGKSDSEIVSSSLPSLYITLGITYMRLGDSENAYRAGIYTRSLNVQSPDAYILMGESLDASGHKGDAAVTFMEGSIITGDQRFLLLLQNAYRSGLDPQGCSFAQTANGPSLNYSCGIVHQQACGASSELSRVLNQSRQQDLALAMRRKALVEIGCSASEVQ